MLVSVVVEKQLIACLNEYEHINIISPQDDNFAMEAGRQPITFENPLYATSPGVSGDPAVIHATQVLKVDASSCHICERSITH